MTGEISAVPKLLFIASCAAALLFSFVGAPSSAWAGDVVVDSTTGEYSLHVTSLRERRFKNVVLQRYDYSCGAAAVATLLSYDYLRPTLEKAPFVGMIKHGDRKRIEKVGFSMLDMKRYLESVGLHPIGVKVRLEQVEKLGVPGIVLIERKGYKHFVVLRAVDARRVLLADPALGMQIVPRDEFAPMWDGIMLLIRDDPSVGHRNFNEQAFWAVRPPAPIGLASTSNGMSLFSQNLFLHNLLIIAF